MAEKDCVIKLNDKLKKMAATSTEEMLMEMEIWKKRSIYKVAPSVAELNKKAYKPQAVSFGPYHHGEEYLKPIEEHKCRALFHFIKRSKKPLEPYFESLAQVVQDLKDSYETLDPIWLQDTNAFLQLMILDGCFMLEILRAATQPMNDYATDDPIFSNHGKVYIMPYIRRDMLMLENQLPLLVLEKLVAVENQKVEDNESVNKLILKFCSPNTSVVSSMGKCLHVLDVYRKGLLWKAPQCENSHHQREKNIPSPDLDLEDGDEIVRTATELYEAGIRFKKSKTRSLQDISFKGGILRLPPIMVDDTTESMFLNQMAFERFHVGAGNEVTSYIFLMDKIIDIATDVSLLHKHGIIQNAIGSDKAVAKLFNSLSNDVTLDPESSLNAVHKKVHKYCKKPWNEWRANLIHTYFRSPWAILSVIAAIFLFALTIVEAISSLAELYKKD